MSCEMLLSGSSYRALSSVPLCVKEQICISPFAVELDAWLSQHFARDVFPEEITVVGGNVRVINHVQLLLSALSQLSVAKIAQLFKGKAPIFFNTSSRIWANAIGDATCRYEAIFALRWGPLLKR